MTRTPWPTVDVVDRVDDDVLDEMIARWPSWDVRGALAREVRTTRAAMETFFVDRDGWPS